MKIHYGNCVNAFINSLNDMNGYTATITTSDGRKREVLMNQVDDGRDESVLLGELCDDDQIPTGEHVEINLNDIELVEV